MSALELVEKSRSAGGCGLCDFCMCRERAEVKWLVEIRRI